MHIGLGPNGPVSIYSAEDFEGLPVVLGIAGLSFLIWWTWEDSARAFAHFAWLAGAWVAAAGVVAAVRITYRRQGKPRFHLGLGTWMASALSLARRGWFWRAVVVSLLQVMIICGVLAFVIAFAVLSSTSDGSWVQDALKYGLPLLQAVVGLQIFCDRIIRRYLVAMAVGHQA